MRAGDRTKTTGRQGEQMACDFLLTRGHEILDRNWHGGHLEIDIVSQASDGLHFVEVKTRTAPVLAPVEMQINPLKQRRVSSAALRYVHDKHLEGKELFFGFHLQHRCVIITKMVRRALPKVSVRRSRYGYRIIRYLK